MNRQLKVVGYEVPKKHKDKESLMKSLISSNAFQDLDASNAAGYPRADVEKDQSGESLSVETVNHGKVINPVIWKPLFTKNADDVYFGGTKTRKAKGKRKSNHQQSEIYNCEEQKNKFWKSSKVKEIFPTLTSKEESVDDLTEEIQYLDLEDFQVYKKRVPREISPPKELWKSGDFPGIGNVIGERLPDNDVKSGGTHSLFCLPNLIGHDQENMKHASIHSKIGRSRKRLCQCSTKDSSQVLQQNKILISRSIQTDESLSYASINVSCQNMPTDLKEIFLNLLTQQKKYKKIISHLSRLLCKFAQNSHLETILSIMSSYEDSNKQFSSSEEEYFLSILIDENVTAESSSCYSVAPNKKK